MRVFTFVISLLLSLTAFARTEAESIDLSLQSLDCNESVMKMSVLDPLIDRYRNSSNALYRRYQQTRKEHSVIAEKMKAEGIPPFFALIPYNESKFNPSVKGYGTAGLWQFGKQSARNFGLTVTKKHDERTDPEKSTDAAIRYIKQLKKEFGSWYLADFAYTMGEGQLKKIIAHQKSKKLSVILKDPHFSAGAKAHFAQTLILDAKINYSAAEDQEP